MYAGQIDEIAQILSFCGNFPAKNHWLQQLLWMYYPDVLFELVE